jgi:hypothetical protein
MKLTIDNQLITLGELRQAWLEPATVDIGPEAQRRIAESREMIEDVVAQGDTVYGVNTGFGQLATVPVSGDDLAQFLVVGQRINRVSSGDLCIEDAFLGHLFSLGDDQMWGATYIHSQVFGCVAGVGILTQKAERIPARKRGHVFPDKIKHTWIHLVHDIRHEVLV